MKKGRAGVEINTASVLSKDLSKTYSKQKTNIQGLFLFYAWNIYSSYVPTDVQHEQNHLISFEEASHGVENLREFSKWVVYMMAVKRSIQATTS